jgi:hydrophobic/amphiphilic exporter-1 (mainly G- bacteria), HAE1 family
MSITELFIKRPIATCLVMLAILLFGVASYRYLAVSDLPNVDFPTIEVSASLPGASPETMASSIATPLEQQFSTIAGLDSMTSANTLGRSSITLQFNLSRDLDGAALDVQSMITQAQRLLPQDMPSPPSFRKVNPADQPVLFLALSSSSLPLSTVDDFAETFMSQRISMISGVAQVTVYGSQKYAVRVQVDPQVLAARQIGIDEVSNAIQNGNVNLPTGTLWGNNRAVTVESNGQLMDAAAFRSLIVAYRNGSPVRLDQIGRVLDSVEDNKTANWDNGKRAIVLAILRQPGTNTVQVVDNVRSLLPEFRRDIPPAIDLNVMYDRSETIRQSVNDVKFTLVLALCLVVLVIFLFLRNASATVIPSLALPMSIVGTFAVMYLLDYSLDNLSLMALTLSVGFVVDDAIVMLENIVRHMEMGEGVLEAAINGSNEIGFTILSMTMSLAAVFIPVLFLGGILGRLLHEFSVTIISTILVSGLVSLSLTPMLCSRFLRPPQEQKHGALFKAFERVQDRFLGVYEGSLHFVLRHKVTTMAIGGAIVVATVYLYLLIPKGFLPSEDTGSIFAFTQAAQGISFDAMVEHQQEVAKIVQADPAVTNLMSNVGGGPSPKINQGILFIQLKPEAVRPPVDQIINELRPKLATVPGIAVYMQNLPPIRIGGNLTQSAYQFTLQSPNTEELYRGSAEMMEKMQKLPGLLDVATDLQISNPQINVQIDRDKASALGVTPAQVENALFSAYGSRQISTIYTPNNQYRVILELEPQYQRDPSQLPLLYVRSSSGQLVPLNTVARLVSNVGPLSVNHLGQLPAVTLSFNLAPGMALGNAIAEVNDLARTTLPSSITTSFQGTAQAFQSSLAGLGILLLMALLVIYIVLGILYESFIHPLTILSGLPAAGFGALLTLLLFHWASATKHWLDPTFDMQLDLYAFVGIIMLIGIVKKNAIMMIDFALEAQRKEGKPPEEAIFQGCVVRFRPIMMTTMAAFMGVLPIALGLGAGGESRRPLGMAVVGGLLFSQLVTLYLTPVVYIYLDRFSSGTTRLLGRGRRRRDQEKLPGRPAPEREPIETPVARSMSSIPPPGFPDPSRR